jgi:hypothetical protein
MSGIGNKAEAGSARRSRTHEQRRAEVACYRVTRLSRRIGIRRGSTTRLCSATTSLLSIPTPGQAKGRFLRSQGGGLDDTTGSARPRRSLAPNVRAWRSGKFQDGTPGTALGVASVRQDPNSAVPGRAFARSNENGIVLERPCWLRDLFSSAAQEDIRDSD